MEWGLVAPEQRRVIKNFQESNYLQALEGDIDTAHVSYLHSTKKLQPQNQRSSDPSVASTRLPSSWCSTTTRASRMAGGAPCPTTAATTGASRSSCGRLRALDVVTPDGELGPVLERYRDKVSVAG